MDVAGDPRRAGPPTLDLYCDRVASAVGRLSVKVFGMADKPGLELAHHLGRALQLTKSCATWMTTPPSAGSTVRGVPFRGGHQSTDPKTVVSDPRIDMAAQVIAATARLHYDAADLIMRRARKREALQRPARPMRAAYGPHFLERMQAVGWYPPRSRIGLSKLEKLWVVVRYGLAA